MLAASDFLASMVIAAGPADDRWAETVALHERAPVSIVQGTLDRPLTAIECVATAPASDLAGAVVSELISVMPADVSIGDVDSVALISRLEPGQLGITTIGDWDRLTAARAPEGAGLLLIPEALVFQTVDARDADGALRA
jgi:hypothetical protein